MKWVSRIFAGIVSLMFVMGIVQMLASESGEVVVLTTIDESGTEQRTRLWIVDLDGTPYLRAGDARSQWYARLVSHPDIRLERDETTLAYHAVPAPQETPRINALMAEKYGWADRYVGAIFPRSGAMAIRLEAPESDSIGPDQP